MLKPLKPINNRGAVGVKDGKNWLAVYNADDSSPIVFGPKIWQILQENWKNLEDWGKNLLNYGYWDEYINGGLCPYCGKYDVGQPYNVKGSLLKAMHKGKIAPDPESMLHDHKNKVGPFSSTTGDVDGFWVEWTYIIKPSEYMLEVMRSVREEGFIKASAGINKWEQPIYRYHSIGLYSLLSDEPDWKRTQKIGLAASNYYWNKYNTQNKKKKFL